MSDVNEGYPEYWNRWEGRIVRSILQRTTPVSWIDLQRDTQLNEYQLNEALSNLFYKQAIAKDGFGNYLLIDDQLIAEWREFVAQNSQSDQEPPSDAAPPPPPPPSNEEDLVKYLTVWKAMKGIDFPLENKHFFLGGAYIDALTKDLINLSDNCILIANPFIENCYLTEAILNARERRRTVKIVTRPPNRENNEWRKSECHSELVKHGVEIKYNSQIHSKIVTVDNRIAIVSSMNFYGSSSGGASLEAGMVSIDLTVVDAASKYIEKLLNRI